MKLAFSGLIPAALICLGCGCSSSPERVVASSASQPGYGTDKQQAIEVCRPEGERNYLARLVCPDSSHPRFSRSGSVGLRHDFPTGMSESEQMKLMTENMGFEKLKPGATDHHVIDVYSVDCGEVETAIYLDMYHCDTPAPTSAPAGFTIIN